MRAYGALADDGRLGDLVWARGPAAGAPPVAGDVGRTRRGW